VIRLYSSAIIHWQNDINILQALIDSRTKADFGDQSALGNPLQSKTHLNVLILPNSNRRSTLFPILGTYAYVEAGDEGPAFLANLRVPSGKVIIGDLVLVHDREACLALFDFVIRLAAFGCAFQGWAWLLRRRRFVNRRVDTNADVCTWDQVCAAVLEDVEMSVIWSLSGKDGWTRWPDINVRVPSKSRSN